MAKHDLIQNARFFDRLVDLVPAKYYHPSDQELVNTKYLKKNAKAAAKQAMKEQYKQNKRAKLNPDTARTSLQIQQEQAQRMQHSDDSEEADEPAQASQKRAAQQQVAQEQKPEPVKTLQLPAGMLYTCLLCVQHRLFAVSDPAFLAGGAPSHSDLQQKLQQRLQVS